MIKCSVGGQTFVQCREQWSYRERNEMRETLKKARQDAGLTQQNMADRLGISLVYYQKIEQGSRTGDFYIWDMLEDITGVHQRKLREISNNHHDREANQ